MGRDTFYLPWTVRIGHHEPRDLHSAGRFHRVIKERGAPTKNALGFLAWLIVPFATAFVGSRFMPGAWYAALVRPTWSPPNAVVAPVWTLLDLLMGVSAWLVWRRAGFQGAGTALAVFGVQLVLNALWSYLFFGLHRPDLALVDIVLLWGAILAVVILFGRVDRVAGALQLPYLAWVTFATALNGAVWWLNRGRLPG
jgi:tryptophan-rich sensory protein